MRLDRFITLNLVQPFRRSLHRGGWGEGVQRSDAGLAGDESLPPSPCLPVLMYHSISDDPEPGVHPYYRVCTSPARFREQMQWLKANGWLGVTLSAGLKANSETGNRKSQIKAVALTFDDGFRDFHTAAWPILREFGFTATMFLPTALIQDHGPRTADHGLPSRPRSGRSHPLQPDWRGAGGEVGEVSNPSPFRGKEFLNWGQIRELHHAGMEFGSHTVNHPKLVELAWPEIHSEIADSKAEIENRLGAPCAAFAYPYAFPQADRNFVARFRDLLKAGGYQTNVTTQIGRHRPGADVLQINRLPVNQADDLSLFAAKLAGAYDWLGRFQSWSKRLRRGRRAPEPVPAPGKPNRLESIVPQKSTKSA